MKVIVIALAAVLLAAGCADELQRLRFETLRHRQAQQEASLAAAGDRTGLAAAVLQVVEYPSAPELLDETARLIRELSALCPRFTPAAIARDLVSRYALPWHRIKADASGVGLSPADYALITIQFVHVGMLEDASATNCGERVGCGKGRKNTLRPNQRLLGHLYSPLIRRWPHPRGEVCGRSSGATGRPARLRLATASPSRTVFQ